jgi:hypothetical protein
MAITVGSGVQVSGAPAGGTGYVVTPSLACSTDDLVLVGLMYGNRGTDSWVQIFDSGGNTWTQAGSTVLWNSGQCRSKLYYATIASGASLTFTSEYSVVGIAVTMFALRVSGITTTTPLDLVDQQEQAHNQTTDYVSPTTGTTAQDSELLVGLCFIATDFAITITANNSFTNQVSEVDGTANWCGALSTRIVSSASTYQGSWTASGATTISGAAHIATFKDADAGGGGASTAEEGAASKIGSGSIVQPSMGGFAS